ncbi:MAG: excinuclease ABC subunit UvrA [Alphaproteobacteria bacterium]|nr:MAG: excinuclease ABC subunit UvrA [Alphaproteobacteria bacterium]
MSYIKIKGAREHNLKNIDINIPKDQLVVITGPSGSGKSSLAFDTIYAEGQRRYVESLSAYARQFLNIAKKPDVDSIEGLSPAISIEQKTVHNNPRSTVATITEIYDYLRLLYARVGIPYSPVTGKPIKAMTPQEIVNLIMKKAPKTKFTVLAPVVRDRKGEHANLLRDIQAKGFSRVKVNDNYYELEDVPVFEKNKKTTVSVVVDRLVMVEGASASSLRGASLRDDPMDGHAPLAMTKPLPHDDEAVERFTLRLTQSIEQALELSDGLVVIDNIDAKTSDLYSSKFSCPESGFSIAEIEPRIFSFNAHAGACKACQGLGFIEEGWYEKVTCEECQGYRLKKESLLIKINDLHIGQFCDMSISEAHQWLNTLKFSRQQMDIAGPVLKEIENRLGFLVNVGLSYLTLNRISGTLSGGEGQRIRLASQIGSQLTGVLYVLDEPSIGLHQRDNDRLIATLKKMRDLGNTIIVVEHDEDTMLAADYIFDIGPKAGIYGGEIVAEGTPQEIMQNDNSVTGQYLSGKKMIPVPKKRRKGSGKSLVVKNAQLHNLKGMDVEFPLGKLICVTGVSGSGKSSLVMGELCNGYNKGHQFLTGVQYTDKLIKIDQKPIGRTPRSNPATYIGVFDEIRQWFCALPEAKARGYSPGRFSFNVPGGRCDACDGDGTIRVSMHFLPDTFTVCETCDGRRYNKQTLEIFYRGKNIADVLSMSIDEACAFFDAHPKIRKKLEFLQRVGLGYLQVGHSATLLSGGEAQRVKLAKELARSSTKDTVYVLDEPTTGLHFDDVKKLLEILHTFVDNGSTVIVIEHNLEVIKTADHVIDMGPEGGAAGGTVVASGTPEVVAKSGESVTGVFLKRMVI